MNIFVFVGLTEGLFWIGVPDCSITKFLNRILGLEVHKQNSLFQYFTDNFDYLIEKDKKEGKYDMGILGTEREPVTQALSSLISLGLILYQFNLPSEKL